MKKLSVCFYIFLLLAIDVTAQIYSTIYSEKLKVFDSYPQFQKLRATAPEIIMPGFDINRLLEEDEGIKGKAVPYRFGKGFDVNYSLADGLWTTVDSGKIWLMKITSPRAYSINFVFKELLLPIRAELYIYSTDGSMVYGPITSKQNMERGLFLTDVIKGESVILYLYVPKNKEVSTKLVISRIVHGYKDLYAGLFKSGDKDGSGGCHKDVACYPDWSNESKGEVQILLASAEEWCSGSLLNNTARNFRAYILTAFHCADCNPTNGEIDYWERYWAEHWAFRFNYKKTSCGGDQVASYFTYNNDDIIAEWNTTDFLLAELDDSPLSHQNLSFLGWDATGNTPTEGTSLHHPSGDVMKIAFDYDQLSETQLGGSPGEYYWQVRWDNGATEVHSSGAPLFDQNKRVIGQLTGGYSECYGSDMRDYYGCLYHSYYPAGGTATSRLINWLDPCGTQDLTMNTIPGAYVTGPDILCTSNAYYYLHNCPSGKTVTWSANSYKVTPSSGTGTSARIRATCNDIGYTTINFTISDACGSSTIEKEFLVAGPDYSEVELDVTYSTGQPAPKAGGTFLLCPYTYYYFYVINNSDCSTSGYQWILPPSISLVYQYNNMACVYTGSNPGGNVRVKATTCCSGCGGNMQILSAYVGTYYNCGGYYFSMSPNPADDYVEISLDETKVDLSNIMEYEVKVYNSQQILLYHTKTSKSSFRISTSQYTTGTYSVHLIYNGKPYVRQLVISH